MLRVRFRERCSQVHSFDVFDTCLLRTCAFPSDIFIELAHALLGSKLSPDECAFAEDFRSARMKAENTARSKTDREDVTLLEIWAELACQFPPYDAAAGAEAELDMERRHLRPNRNVLSMVKAARESGERIVFLSDMYLPAAFIREQLACHGFFLEGDGLFVSSEVGLTKRTGNLFRHMLRLEKVGPGCVRHYGDNAVSDVQIPRTLGIDAHHCGETALEHCERGLVNASLSHRHAATRLAGRCRLFRLPGDTAGDENRSLVAAFLGPFLLTFASWVLARARRDGVRRLYFLSRDCYLLSHVSRVLAPKFGIEARYLYVSRQSLFLPSIREISESGIPWLRRSFEKATIQRLLRKLDLADTIASALVLQGLGAKDEQHVVEGDAQWARFWQIITAAPVCDVLAERICERRKQAERYFAEQGLDNSGDWALADLGWYLTCQTALRGLLNRNTTQGYYLGLRPGRNSPVEAGRAQALFYDEPADRSPAAMPALIFSRIDLLEHILGLAPHGTVHHYEPGASGATPVCSKVEGTAFQAISKFEQLTMEFAAANADLTDELGTGPVARAVIDQLTGTFFGKPKREWVEALRFIRVARDQNNLDAAPLARPVTWNAFLVACLPQRLQRRYPSPAPDPWPEASLCISSEALQNAIRMRTGTFALPGRIRRRIF
jgi:FMN phosphatase YigB (HAD superfamily)